MKTLDEVLGILEARTHRAGASGQRVDRAMLEDYIAREWVRPRREPQGWHFEEIDVARVELICHLAHDIEVNDEGMDVVLSLLDQLYGMRAYMQKLTHAIAQQSPEVQTEIRMVLKTPKHE